MEIPRQPFCWRTLASVLRRFPYPFAERVGEDGKICRLFEDGDGELHRVEAPGRIPSKVDGEFRHVFEWDSPVRAQLMAHPRADCLGAAVSLPVLRWESTFAALVSTIVEQQNSWKSATRGIFALFQGSARRVSGLTMFPEPWELLEKRSLVEQLPITYRRRDLILNFAEELRDDPASLDRLCSELETAEAQLLKLPGIGSWTARVFLSKRYGYRPDVPLKDVALQRAAAGFLCQRDGKLTPAELEEEMSVFGELAGEAAHRLLLRFVLETYPVSPHKVED